MGFSILGTAKARFLRSLAFKLRKVNILNLDPKSKFGSGISMKGVTARGYIEIGDHTKITDSVSIQAKRKLTIGRYTSINGPNTDIVNYLNEVHIGSFTSIARSVSIQEFNHRTDAISTYHVHHNIFESSRENDIYSNGPIHIGNDVWIGAQCVILSGALIGDGAVVAANSVVIGEVPPYSIVAGSPAKVIGQRFDEETVNQLLALKWWEKPINEILLNQKLFKEKLNGEMLSKWKSL